MPLTYGDVFQYIYQAYSTGIAGAITAVIDRVLSAARGPLNAMLVLLLMLYGYQLIAAQGAYAGQAMGRLIRMGVVIFLVSNTSAYNYYVVSLFSTGLPNFFAQHIAGAPGGTNPGASFDVILTNMWIDTTTVWRDAPGWIRAMFFDFAAIAAFVIVASALVLMFAVFLVVQTLINVTVAIGPLIILGWLYDYTKKIVNGWIDVLITLSIVTLAVNILLELLVKAMGTALSDATLTGPANQQLFELLSISLVVLVLSASVVVLPRMIERIAGGVAAGVGLEAGRRWIRGEPAWRGGAQAVRYGPTVAASSTRGARRGAAAAAQNARRIANRLRGRKEG